MGRGMICATARKTGGAQVAQVAQNRGLRHCATTSPRYTGGRGGGADGGIPAPVAQSGAQIGSRVMTRTFPADKPAMIARFRTLEDCDAYPEGCRLTGREPTPEEWAALARRKAELQRGQG